MAKESSLGRPESSSHSTVTHNGRPTVILVSSLILNLRNKDVLLVLFSFFDSIIALFRDVDVRDEDLHPRRAVVSEKRRIQVGER